MLLGETIAFLCSLCCGLGGGDQPTKQTKILFFPLIAKVCFQKVWQCSIYTGLAQRSGNGLLLLKPWINPLLQLVVLFIGTEQFSHGKVFPVSGCQRQAIQATRSIFIFSLPKMHKSWWTADYRVLIFSVVMGFWKSNLMVKKKPFFCWSRSSFTKLCRFLFYAGR